MRSDRYQYALILFSLMALIFFAVFFQREIFPEYKIYQQDYIALEKFRSTYTGQPLPVFTPEIKQIVIESPTKGSPTIDRCLSCHVALQLDYFSPTKLARDETGKIKVDDFGIPIKIPNEEYIWEKLDQKIVELTDTKVIEQWEERGEHAQVNQRLKEAEKLKSLKIANVGDKTYEVTKVLSMHPLMGKETRPFEFHPLEDYGCVICHNGNGRALTTDKAHGPVFDGDYEVEEMGHSPKKFLEVDPDNDPQFSHVFNHKPGHHLLFQTTPIFVGSLIQAKCLQCHQRSSGNSNSISQVDLLTKDYQRGKELFITQACYACHRIGGYARGGIGPELTRIGNSYPWYIKQSIVWPQADLANSTMPLYNLDHQELEGLMTYLLAQKGINKAVSEMDYQKTLHEWETGKQTTWEQPVNPVKMQDLRYGMTIFATEGCAACHRLKGFESNVGFSIEKDQKNSLSFEQVYEEKSWFEKLFPEEILGSDVVRALENNRGEIEKRIVDGVRENSLLEEISKRFPGIIEGFYSNFKYAKRAKNKYYAELIKQNSDQKEELTQQWNQWKEMVHRVLMVYIQEYGLGRLIGPKPNWSGIFRTDEWLMEHFKNPSAHVPRSIMPIFPFDDSKFYALTKMLDQLSVKNRNEVRQIWKHKGFSPALAVHIHCAQCHGENLQGNGPVAEWIYPIPKNLRNADFLRNLTRERFIDSVVHGVKGTPMSPWGEIDPDKSKDHQIPVLTKGEVSLIADWLYSSVQGGEVLKTSQDVPKWQYGPQDVIKDLKREEQQIPHQNVEKIFDIQSNSSSDIDKHSYYIKKKYYTEKNIEQGKRFFNLNCAACHGAEADGSSLRAEVMQEAKPRMLTNMDWLKSRDDLRLLRSIKYGVPGTSMTPWGDMTNALQRMQLVIFIRSLTAEKEQRDELNSTLFIVFENAKTIITLARSKEYSALEKLNEQHITLEAEESKRRQELAEGKNVVNEASKIYADKLLLLQKIEKQQKIDQSFTDLIDLIHQEKKIAEELGNDLIAKALGDEILENYIEMIKLNKDRYSFNSTLEWNEDQDSEKRQQQIAEKIVEVMNLKLQNLERDKKLVENKFKTAEVISSLAKIDAEIISLTKLKGQLMASMNERQKLQDKQRFLYKHILNAEVAEAQRHREKTIKFKITR